MKWFKQLSLALIDSVTCPSIDVFEEKLQQYNLPMMTSLSKSVQGFVPAYSFTEQMIFAINDSWKMTLKKEEKLLPSYIVNDELTTRIEQIEKQEYRKISHKEKRALKELIVDELLPRAFVKQSSVEAIYHTTRGFLLINQANENKREQFISELRQALGQLKITIPKTKTTISTLMTTWLIQGYAQGHFILDDFCELKNMANTANIIKFFKHNLLTHEIQDMVKSNHFVSQLALIWDHKIRLVLSHDFTLKNIQLLDMDDSEHNNEEYHEHNEIMLANANQLMMSEYLSQIYHELIKHAGGLVEESV